MNCSVVWKDRLDCVRRALGRLTVSLTECRLCPRSCGKNRLAGERGFCQAGAAAKVFRFGPHFGEEPPITGTRGSGTIFFSHCSMQCIYCQNFRFSQEHAGKEVTAEELSGIMLLLQQGGCHNLNLVTPSHFLPQTLQALARALQAGFRLPIVYNTSSYESVETIEALDGIVDIYLADARYSDDELALKYSNAPGYVHYSRQALRAMWRQVGPLVLDENDIAQKGLIVRHLVLPGQLDQARATLEWVAANISTNVAVSLMGQYRPLYKALQHPTLGRRLSPAEYDEALRMAKSFDFETLFVQRPDSDFPEELLGEKMPSSW